jgi:hypothetical protein
MPFRIRGFGDFDSVSLSVIPSEIACEAVALCEGLEESLILSERRKILDFARRDKMNHFRSATIKFASL